MGKNTEQQKIEEKLRKEIADIAISSKKLASAIGQLEINKFNIINSDNPDPNKISELEISKNLMVRDSINLRREFKNKLKEGLLRLNLNPDDADKYSIDLSSGLIKKCE